MVIGKGKESEKNKRVVGKEREQERRKGVLCKICFNKKTESKMYVSQNCSHFYCYACIGKYVATKISENIVKVKCPDLGCNNFLEPQNCKSFIPHETQDRWEAALCESVIGLKRINCPFKNCLVPFVVNDGKEVLTSAECPRCHRLFCAQCLVPWHAGSKCKRKDNDNMDKLFMSLAKTEKWQKCPHCSYYVERIDGCESIKCRCGHNFCYICGKGWSFGHRCSTTSTAGGAISVIFILLTIILLLMKMFS